MVANLAVLIFYCSCPGNPVVGMDANDPPTPMTNNGPKKFFVAGVEVEFPMKPYKCQISTMNMVRTSLGVYWNQLKTFVQEWAEGVLLRLCLLLPYFVMEVLYFSAGGRVSESTPLIPNIFFCVRSVLCHSNIQ
jgi:hypothetical protein